jgi:YfiH family protein
MEKKHINGLRLWQFESLLKEPGVKHFVTDRSAGDNGKEFTLSLLSLPDRNEVLHNRSLLAAAMGVPANKLLLPSQVHKTNIVQVGHYTTREELMDTDALITSEKGLCVAVMAADCVPILLYDTKNGAVGAVHSGWRGTVAMILEKTLQQMQTAFGTEGKDLVACIGPSVCQESYEVGEEVVQEVQNAFGTQSGLLIPQASRKAKLDLWKANKIQLLDFGVAPSNIEISDLCTVKNNEHFFSARKGDSGRFAAGIMLV